MIDERIHVAIRSYKRAGRVTTLDVLPFAHIWVPESQGDDYRQHYGDRVITIPDALDGNSARKFNAILDRRPTDWVLVVDDDITAIGYFERDYQFFPDPDYLAEMIVHHFTLAHDLGVKLWGINQTYDALHYRTLTPFSLLAPILGPFMGILDTPLRFDERLPLKEDYDYWLQHLQKYRKTLRVNKYHYYHDHGSEPGGVVSFRTEQGEREQLKLLQQKWGAGIVKRAGGSSGGKSATGKNVLNVRIHVPIPGC